VHVGDSAELDVAGAQAAGIRPVLVLRDGAPTPPGLTTIPDLSALPPLLGV
jgi:putative hydrolase of the HAD superfamily